MEDEEPFCPKPVVGITVGDVSSEGTDVHAHPMWRGDPGSGESQQLMTQASYGPMWVNQEVEQESEVKDD